MLGMITRAWRAFVWYVKSVMGESDYEVYVNHLRRHHPDAEVPTVSQYWRDRYREEGENPGSRCC